MNAALSIASTSYSVSGLDILRNLNLEVASSEYFAIAGVNGAGKSTLIKLVLDLIRPSPGASIRIFESDNRDLNCRQQLAYLPEKFDVKKNTSGQQYLEFIASVYQQSPDMHKVEELCLELDFPIDRLRSRVGEYSKGMVQKIGLVSCFMLERPLTILDEPLSGLDPRARYHFKQLMKKQKSSGRTVLYSTHMLADAEDLCDHFGILHQGEMKYIGTPESCMTQFGADSLEQAYMNCISEP
ncbi:MAG: ABC transporter ATP-binding protein [Pseudomonadota bacterium]